MNIRFKATSKVNTILTIAEIIALTRLQTKDE